MATPARLVKLSCPACRQPRWVIDNDCRGTGWPGEDESDYPDRRYCCATCGFGDIGWEVLEKSPSNFLRQPQPLYPMSQKAFDYWAALLREHFPDHRLVSKIGAQFRPSRSRLKPVLLMRHYYYGRLQYHIGKRLGWHGTPMFCTHCGAVASPKTHTKGSTAFQRRLWFCFLLPGLCYSVWRLLSRYKGCPNCLCPNMIPTDSLKAREMLALQP